MQDVLAKALHRLCKIPTKETGNDFQDVKHFEERLNIEIQVYNFESRQIYKGTEEQDKVRNVKLVKVKLNAVLMNRQFHMRNV